jgi:lysophospholipase L1-like esterase
VSSRKVQYTDTEKTTLDNTHLSNAGAYKTASMIADEVKKLNLSIGELKK